MRITINKKNHRIEDALRSRLEKKVAKLEKYFHEKDEVDVQVRLSEEKGGRNIAEITIVSAGDIIRAEDITNDMFMSVDNALNKIERQIYRHRKKFEARLRKGSLDSVEPEIASEPEFSGELVRTKHFTMKPMEVEDAIAQMDMLGHVFFLFINAENGITSVVYKRDDGNYGLLEPENA